MFENGQENKYILQMTVDSKHKKTHTHIARFHTQTKIKNALNFIFYFNLIGNLRKYIYRRECLFLGRSFLK